ncbi:MAG: Asp-tRNA(Asn)/Glu-tRNA(Gln) amidotransferase subunit GatB [Vicinamibacterales bacterium]
MAFQAVIGLEVHAQLLTRTKIFCGCSTAFGNPPNSNTCPVCLGLPGAMPVLNRSAVELAIRAGLALGCTIQPTSVFARKNYFYPDLPKGYQISQYELPIATDGRVAYKVGDRQMVVGIHRAHLEEDAGKSLHEGFPDSGRRTYLDFNRSGVPLLEIVTRPDLSTPADAADFFGRLRTILVAIGVNDGNMEEGSLRCDANVSVRPIGSATLGTKTEIKNLNSFRFVQKALEFEIARQSGIVREGGRIHQETRLFDPVSLETRTMRSKEEAHDYRYFPEPDLPPLVVDGAWVDAVRASLPELPDARTERFAREYGLSDADAAFLAPDALAARYFETLAAECGSAKVAANWMKGDLARKMKIEGHDFRTVPLSAGRLAGLIKLVAAGRISGPAAKQVLDELYASGEDADAIVERQGLVMVDDTAVVAGLVDEVLRRHEDAVAQYRKGKTASLGFLVGQVVRASGGKANPKRATELLRERLDAPE